MNKICPACGKEFETTNKFQIICSEECRKNYRKKYLDKAISTLEVGRKEISNRGCYACGKFFERSFANEKFCSDECRLKYFKVSKRVGL